MQILLFAPRMAPLAHIHMYIDNTAAYGWANRDSVGTASSVKPILREPSLAAMRHHIHASIGRILGEDNKIVDAASRLIHLPDQKFISHFCTHFLESKPWRLLPLPPGCKHQLTIMLHNKKSTRSSLPPCSKNIPPHGANGGASAAGSKSPPTLRTLRTPFPSSRFSTSAYVLAFYPHKGSLSRSNGLSNTSTRSVKSLHPWGPTTLDTTA